VTLLIVSQLHVNQHRVTLSYSTAVWWGILVHCGRAGNGMQSR